MRNGTHLDKGSAAITPADESTDSVWAGTAVGRFMLLLAFVSLQAFALERSTRTRSALALCRDTSAAAAHQPGLAVWNREQHELHQRPHGSVLQHLDCCSPANSQLQTVAVSERQAGTCCVILACCLSFQLDAVCHRQFLQVD